MAKCDSCGKSSKIKDLSFRSLCDIEENCSHFILGILYICSDCDKETEKIIKKALKEYRKIINKGENNG